MHSHEDVKISGYVQSAFWYQTGAFEHMGRFTRDRVDDSSEAVSAVRRRTRAVEVIMCMITREFSLTSMALQACLSLSIYLSTTHEKSLTHNILGLSRLV